MLEINPPRAPWGEHGTHIALSFALQPTRTALECLVCRPRWSQRSLFIGAETGPLDNVNQRTGGKLKPPFITTLSMAQTHEDNSCRNCDAPLTGPYCSQCGQSQRASMLSVFALVREFFSEIFELDGRLLRTLLPFLFRPGFLTLEFVRGRRARYISPIRLFLAFSACGSSLAGGRNSGACTTISFLGRRSSSPEPRHRPTAMPIPPTTRLKSW